MEVVRPSYAQFEQELPPLLVVEATPQGWRGLTKDGMLLNVEATSGIPFGGHIAVHRNGEHIGFRAVPRKETPGLISRYLRSVEIARKASQSGYPANALVAIETAASFVPTLSAQYSRGMILLELHRWREGFDDYAQAMEYPGSMFARPQYRECVVANLTRWRGEDIAGKKFLLIHDHGFGDSIMMLRYVPMLKAMGAEVLLWLPPELERLASQCATVVREPALDADFFLPLLFLFQMLGQSPESIPVGPYLKVDPVLVDKWRNQLGPSARRTVGIAWSPGVTNEHDYPRAVPLGLLRKALPDARLVSVQQQGGDEAGSLGVGNHSFEDFADCAALMACCDEIVTIDTAAAHLAGAIGHPNIKLLLSHWSSWRWQSQLYANLHICRQDKAGDWESALAKL